MKLRLRIAMFSKAALILGIHCSVYASDVSRADVDFSNAVIVVGRDATLLQKHAAQELSDHLEQIVARKFKITDSPTLNQPCILVGPQAAKHAEPAFSSEDLGDEGFVIRTVGNYLMLAGGKPHATLYAVYTFLEDHLGCRWWSSTESTVPKRGDLRIAPTDIRTIPPLEYREALWFDAMDGNWSARNKANGCNGRLEEKHGG
jgi:hypothetical protein